MIEAEEQALVEKLVVHAPVETLAKACWRDEMPDDLLSCAQANMAFEVNLVPSSETIMPAVTGTTAPPRLRRSAERDSRVVRQRAGRSFHASVQA